MKIHIITLTFLSAINAQTLDIQDLTNNNGYIPIKIGETRTIEQYSKILHVINITSYINTLGLIHGNMRTLNTTGLGYETNGLLGTITKNYDLLKGKIDNLNPPFRRRRGLANIVGKGLKYIAGTMDNDDEIDKKNALKSLSNQTNDLTILNNIISDQIKNITEHINQKQVKVGTYLNNLKNYLQNKLRDLEDEVKFIANVYQINNDISLLRDHVDDIGYRSNSLRHTYRD